MYHSDTTRHVKCDTPQARYKFSHGFIWCDEPDALSEKNSATEHVGKQFGLYNRISRSSAPVSAMICQGTVMKPALKCAGLPTQTERRLMMGRSVSALKEENAQIRIAADLISVATAGLTQIYSWNRIDERVQSIDKIQQKPWSTPRILILVKLKQNLQSCV